MVSVDRACSSGPAAAQLQDAEGRQPGPAGVDAVLNTCDIAAADPNDPRFLVIPGGFRAQGPNNLWRLFIVDVNGARLVTMLNYFEDIPQADVAAARAIIDSFVITP